MHQVDCLCMAFNGVASQLGTTVYQGECQVRFVELMLCWGTAAGHETWHDLCSAWQRPQVAPHVAPHMLDACGTNGKILLQKSFLNFIKNPFHMIKKTCRHLR